MIANRPTERSRSAETFEVFFDGECPICRREIEWLVRHDRHGRLTPIDIAAPGFDAAHYGLDRQRVYEVLHVITADREVLHGMEAARAIYRAAGRGWIMAPTAWPGLRWVFDRLYRLFARNRTALGRCVGGKCRVRPPLGTAEATRYDAQGRKPVL